MNNALTGKQAGKQEVEQFNAERHRLNVAALDYGIEEAKRIKDWPALEQAVDAKIDEQHKFVAWWNGNIRDKGKKANNRDPGYFVKEVEQLTGMHQQRVSDLGKRLTDRDRYRNRLLGAEFRAAMLETADVPLKILTGQFEWYTPPKYIELARKVLGDFDLDPASNDIAQRWIKAARHYSLSDDGLVREWHGRVWLNPPYSQPWIARFMEKITAEYASGRTTAAIMLTHNYTDTAWFHQGAESCTAICFNRGRINFVDRDGESQPGSSTNGQAFFYFGPDIDRFASVFAGVGFIVAPIRL